MVNIGTLLLVLSSHFLLISGAPQLGTGRTCDNTPCLRDEVCVMEQGRCDYRGQCIRYPTCRVPKRSPAATCQQYRCPVGQLCTIQESPCAWPPCPSRPACVSSNHTATCEQYRCPPGQFCTMQESPCTWRPCPSRPACVSPNSKG